MLAVALGGAWVVVRGLEARSELAAASEQIPALRQQIVHGDQSGATRALAAVAAETRKAHSLTSDPVWRAYEKLPWLGRSLRTSSGLAAAADRLSVDVLPPLVSAAKVLDPSRLRTGDTIALGPFTAAQPALNTAAAQTKAVLVAVQGLPATGLVGPVAKARVRLLAQLSDLAGTTATAATTADLLPPMLGADGPRTYFLSFQNNAESRGTGGLMGAFGVATADHGRITVTRTGSDADLKQYAKPVVSLGPEFDSLYRPFGAETDLRQSNMSPHFPDAARIWSVMWQRQSHHPVDGVLALDPVAMAGILNATGPATLPGGQQVSGADVVALTEQKAYDRFTDPSVRKQYLQVVAHAMFTRLINGGGSPAALVSGLGSAVGAHHLQLWSAHTAEQARLETLPISGVLTETPGPYAQLVVNNAAGGKLDYYLHRSLSYTAGACSATGRDTTITVALTNAAPASGLSAYALTRGDKPDHPYPPGQNRTLVSVYGAVGASLTSATLNGRPAVIEVTKERGHPRYSRYLEIDPGATGTLVLHLHEPATATGSTSGDAGGANVPVQPLVNDQVTHVFAPPCR